MPRAPEHIVRDLAMGVSRLVAGGLTPDEVEAQLDDLAGLYAEHTDVRHPFAPPGTPWAQHLSSRAELRAHFAGVRDLLADVERFEPVDVVVHTTGDPEVVITEFAYEGQTPDRAIRIPNIFVVRVRDGEIVESRDYAAHAAASG